MNTSALLFIILGYWIFVLQSKVKHLEKLVYSLKDTQPTEKETLSVSSVENKTVEKDVTEINSVTVTQVQEEPTKNVQTFKQSYSEPVSKEPSRFVAFITDYFTGGNLLVRIGGVVLFFGLAFLVKYAAEHSIISMQVRLISIAVIAVVLVIVGWKLREREGAYGQILQGLGIAMFYLVIYAASKFYALLSLDIAFGLMFLVVIIGSVLAVMEDALPLALFATAGGFLVPILTSSGDGSHIMLFSYYAMLNLGIFVVAWYRSWRILNVMGFLFTFVIAGAWGVLRYRSDLFSSTEPFLILYFIMYLTISILFTLKHPFRPKNFVDGTLVFGLPIVAFPLQVNLVQLFDYGEAISSVALGTLYLSLFFWLKNKERTYLLAQSFLALSIVFYTIAIPYIFEADVSAALWSLESAAIIWISLKQDRPLARYFGEFLLLLSIFVYPENVLRDGINLTEYLGFIIVIGSSFSTAYLLDTYKKLLSELEGYLPFILISLALFLWFISTPSQLERVDLFYGHTFLFSLLLGAFLIFLVAKWSQWKLLIQTLQGYFLFAMMIFFIHEIGISNVTHPFEHYGAVAWGTFTLLSYLFLYQYDKEWQFTKQTHILTLWFVTLILVTELHYHAKSLEMGKSIVAMSIILIPLLISILLLMPKKYITWLEKYRNTYQFIGVGGLIMLTLLWEFHAFTFPPDLTVWSYIPLLNPLDLMQILGLGVSLYWIQSNKHHLTKDSKVQMYGSIALLATLLASVIFARSVHMFRAVNYTMASLWNDLYFQAGLSILWSVIAIVLMLLSKRYKNRPLWLAGFGLLILVVLKLFFVELASSGTIERIISFIVVGTLLLLIGYFVPLPPNENEKKENHDI